VALGEPDIRPTTVSRLYPLHFVSRDCFLPFKVYQRLSSRWTFVGDEPKPTCHRNGLPASYTRSREPGGLTVLAVKLLRSSRLETACWLLHTPLDAINNTPTRGWPGSRVPPRVMNLDRQNDVMFSTLTGYLVTVPPVGYDFWDRSRGTAEEPGCRPCFRAPVRNHSV